LATGLPFSSNNLATAVLTPLPPIDEVTTLFASRISTTTVGVPTTAVTVEVAVVLVFVVVDVDPAPVAGVPALPPPPPQPTRAVMSKPPTKFKIFVTLKPLMLLMFKS
jgi:hypothetical protein